jgi:hypothetical protein
VFVIFILSPLYVYFIDKKKCNNKLTYIIKESTFGYEVRKNYYEYPFNKIESAKIRNSFIKIWVKDRGTLNIFFDSNLREDVLKRFKKFV